MDSARCGAPSVYHIECDFFVDASSTLKRCSSCTRHRTSLASLSTQANRLPRDEYTHLSSHTPYTALCTPEKDEQLCCLHSEVQKSKQKVEYLRQKIAASVESNPADVDRELDDDLRKIIVESQDDVQATYPEGSFQQIFWEEQQKASALQDQRSMKWHPLFIKWCLYLRHVSGKAYDMLR